MSEAAGTAKGVWELDPAHSEVTFRVKHLVITSISGKFERFKATFKSRARDFSDAEVTFDAEVASINTGNAQRDAHLQSDDFFNAAMFPHVVFKSTGMRKLNDSQFRLDGDITIRDVTKPITLDVEVGGIAVDPYGQTKAGFEVSGRLSRREFGLKWNALTEAGGAVAGDEVRIFASVQFIKK
jgi:polyisoprenoid-binding protein YceI